MRKWALFGCIALAGCKPVAIRSTIHELHQRETRSTNPVLVGALKQLEAPARYDAAYVPLKFPNGDVPSDRGACADVVVRALRYAGHDLQVLIRDDSRKHRYPNIYRPDSNIDHRRVVNQEAFFERHGKVKSSKVDSTTLSQWQPGDIVTWRLPGNKAHVGIISDRKRSDGLPLVIHNMGPLREEDALTAWTIHGHYRYPVRARSSG